MKARRLLLQPLVRRCVPAVLAGLGALTPWWARADATPQALPFTQNWSDTGLITANDNWSGVPGIVGYRGDDLTTTTGTDPQTILGVGGLVVNVIANQTNPNTLTTGGVAEFALPDPTIALNGSGTADAPHIVIHLDTRGQQAIQVAYVLRDLDGSADNAIQPVALQYRIGNSGNFVNVPAGYVADATSGPSLATLVTPVLATLPADADNQSLVQVRIITSNAVGNDEWVGIDDISITGTAIGGGVNQPIATTCPATLSVDAGFGGTVQLRATDSDSVVNAATLGAGSPAGITLTDFTGAGVDGGTAVVDLRVDPSLAAGSYPVVVSFGNNELQTADCNVTVTVNAVVGIPQIQGVGATSPLEGQTVTTRGIVTRVNDNGFFLQDPVGDGDSDTSDGIFVFTGSAAPAVAVVGNELRVTGTVTEFKVGTGADAQSRPVTQLASPAATLVSSGHAVTPVDIVLPEAAEGELERYEGMLVRIVGPLTASQNFFLGRYGQVTLAVGGRLQKPTNIHPAGSPQAIALADENARRRILLDDGTTAQNPDPTPYIGADDTLRAGDTVAELVGVIDYGLATNLADGISDYKIHPTEPVVFVRSNPRPSAPPPVGGNVRVGSFNVLNYFTTIDQPGASCFPSGTRSDCRGADSAAEFTRQRTKIIAAVLGLNADALGLIEVENNGNVAVQNLVDGLNAVAGAGTYAAVPVPPEGTGADAIRVAMIYKPGRLSLVGTSRSDMSPVHNRPPLAQTFMAANGERFTLVVNHFKSKGGCPNPTTTPNADALDYDQGDGQGCWNATRIAQARALASFVGQLQAIDPDVVVVGDLNAYGKEDPVLTLAASGLVDELARFNTFNYSYVFDGEAGYLDHALTTATMSAQVAGAAFWAVNADEPSVIDYNVEFKKPLCATCGPDYYTPTPYRSSDHDPVIVGLSLVKSINGTAGRDALVGTPGDDRIIGGPGADTLTGGGGADSFVYTSVRDAHDTITDFVPGIDRIDLSALLQSIGRDAATAIGDGVVRLVDTSAGVGIQIDTDGFAGAAAPRTLLVLTGVSAAQIMPSRDLGL